MIYYLILKNRDINSKQITKKNVEMIDLFFSLNFFTHDKYLLSLERKTKIIINRKEIFFLLFLKPK
jgi:hypothetical protein